MNFLLPISEIMTQQVVTISENDTVQVARELFDNYSFHHLPVINEQNKLIGIISMVDLPNAKKNGLTEVWQIMTPEPTILTSDDTIGLAADIFLANSFHAVPIMEGNTLVGILTTHDLINYAYKSPF